MKKLLFLAFLCVSLQLAAEEFTTDSAISVSSATSSAVTVDNSFDSGFSDTTTSSVDSENTDEQKIPLSFEGNFIVTGRDYLHRSFKLETIPELNLKVKVDKNNTKAVAVLNFQKDLTSVSDIFKEGYIKLNFKKFDISVGLMKLVWGKADKLHVVDNLNYTDNSDFLNKDFMDKKIAEKMIHFNYFLDNGSIEAVYTPEFHGDIFPATGVWAQSSLIQLNTAFKSVGTTYDAQLKKAEQNTEKGQIALRYTTSVSGFDIGFSDYQGYLKKPSINKLAIGKLQAGAYTALGAGAPAAFLTELNPHFDKVNIIGAEIATVKLGINWRGEAAYFITGDSDGTDVQVANNKIGYIIGGDKDLPLNNVNVNVQVIGELKIKSDKIKGNPLDTEYDADDKYTSHVVIAQVSDKYFNEKVKPNFKIYYNIEKSDYVLRPEVVFAPNDERTFTVSYMNYGGKSNTVFGQFNKNDFIEAKLEVKF